MRTIFLSAILAGFLIPSLGQLGTQLDPLCLDPTACYCWFTRTQQVNVYGEVLAVQGSQVDLRILRKPSRNSDIEQGDHLQGLVCDSTSVCSSITVGDVIFAGIYDGHIEGFVVEIDGLFPCETEPAFQGIDIEQFVKIESGGITKCQQTVQDLNGFPGFSCDDTGGGCGDIR